MDTTAAAERLPGETAREAIQRIERLPSHAYHAVIATDAWDRLSRQAALDAARARRMASYHAPDGRDYGPTSHHAEAMLFRGYGVEPEGS